MSFAMPAPNGAVFCAGAYRRCNTLMVNCLFCLNGSSRQQNGRSTLHKLQEELAGNTGQKGQEPLRFVRRGVCCCSAVARGSLSLPSPSLGVSSLDLGRSRKVSGLFLFRRHSGRPGRVGTGLFGRRAVGPQLFERDFAQPVGQDFELAGEPGERGHALVAALIHIKRPVDLELDRVQARWSDCRNVR